MNLVSLHVVLDTGNCHCTYDGVPINNNNKWQNNQTCTEKISPMFNVWSTFCEMVTINVVSSSQLHLTRSESTTCKTVPSTRRPLDQPPIAYDVNGILEIMNCTDGTGIALLGVYVDDDCICPIWKINKTFTSKTFQTYMAAQSFGAWQYHFIFIQIRLHAACFTCC